MLLMLLALACQPRPAPTPEPAPPPPAPSPAPPPPPPGAAPGEARGWASPSCGARAYERRIFLHPDFSYTTEERVAPCPPDVTCVWSGVLNTRGTWAEAGDILTFTETEGGPQGEPRPTTLRWTADRAGLVEVQGEVECPYAPFSPAPDAPTQAP